MLGKGEPVKDDRKRRAPSCTSEARARKVGRGPRTVRASVLDGRGRLPQAPSENDGTDGGQVSGRQAAAQGGREGRQPSVEEDRSEAQPVTTRSSEWRCAQIPWLSTVIVASNEHLQVAIEGTSPPYHVVMRLQPDFAGVELAMNAEGGAVGVDVA